MPHLPTDAASDVCSTAHERVATKQTARQAAARTGFDAHWTIRAPAALLLALRICTSYSTRLAPCIRGHTFRNAAHEGFCISLLESIRRPTRATFVAQNPCVNCAQRCWRAARA